MGIYGLGEGGRKGGLEQVGNQWVRGGREDMKLRELKGWGRV